MCGTSHNFSSQYKLEKKEQMKIQYEKRKVALAHQKRKKRLPKTIEYPDDARISSQQVLALSREKLNRSYNLGSKQSQSFLSPEQRSIAFNYRRLNQLSLRQKSARRRKMWQRVYDSETGTLQWVRLPISDVFISNAPFGYTPRHSISESNKWLTSYNLGLSGGSTQTNDTGRILLQAAASEPSQIPDVNSVSSSGNSVLVHGNIVIPGVISLVHNNSESTTGRSSPYQAGTRNREPSDDSFGDNALLSSSPGFSTVLDGDGNLNWERIDSKNILPKNSRKPGNPVESSNTGPISINASSNPSPWSRIFSRTSSNPSSHLHESQITSPLLVESSDTSVSIQISHEENVEALMHDLETIASLSFKEKQLWFIDRMSELQKPWSEGCVRLGARTFT